MGFDASQEKPPPLVNPGGGRMRTSANILRQQSRTQGKGAFDLREALNFFPPRMRGVEPISPESRGTLTLSNCGRVTDDPEVGKELGRARINVSLAL